MTITSKYNGKCKVCGGRIYKGERINWSRGRGASHAECGGDNRSAYQKGDRSPGAIASHYDRYGVYGADGHYMGSTCNCIDYPCCGH